MFKKILLLVLFSLAGCQTNPIKEAETVEQKAYALYGTFVVFEETAVKLVLDPTVPDELKTSLRKADAEAKPLADKLYDLAATYSAIRAQVAMGTSDEDKQMIAAANLANWYYQVKPQLINFVNSVKEIK